MGRVQVAHVAVGTPARELGLSHGSLEIGFVCAIFAGEDLAGRGNGRAFCPSEELKTPIPGGSEGLVTEITGLVVSSGKLTLGFDEASLLAICPIASSSSGRLMVGTAGAETVMAGMVGLGRMAFLSAG
jgi:hypothetical protein